MSESADSAGDEAPAADARETLRILEAVLFAAADPLPESVLAAHLPAGAPVRELLAALAEFYAGRGINLVELAGGWAFRTAPDLASALSREAEVQKKLSRAALETLAIVAYHQPVTRADIEEIRGVAVSRGTLDILFEQGWIAPRGRRRSPGRPATWVTTPAFLDHFGLAGLDDLPGIEELKAAGLLDAEPPAGAAVLRLVSDTDADDGDADDEDRDDEDRDDGDEDRFAEIAGEDEIMGEADPA